VDTLLGADAPQDMETAVALLDDFLLLSDFASLRAGDPDLAGHAGCRVLVNRDDDGVVTMSKLGPRKGA
jgi:hypothetical protein